jgi:class 3 adenylate cyclase
VTAGVRRYRWEWRLRSAPRALWPYVADTNRFNRDTGLPAVERVAGPGGGLDRVRRRLRLRRLGVSVEWEEEPFEWIWPRRFGVVRRYARGPLREMRVVVELEPDGEGTRLVYSVEVRPRGALGRLAVPVEVGWGCRRAFEAAIRRYDALAAAPPAGPPGPAAPPPGAVVLSGGARARLAGGQAALVRGGADAALVARLGQTIAGGDDLTLARLRPYALADRWGAPRRAVLELCLAATRAGLLDLRWQLLCPLCRGPQAAPGALRDVRGEMHCETCRIEFTTDFERLVELTFRPNPAIRAVEDREFCVGGPQVTPHVVLQQLLAPGERRTLAVALEPGRYRARALAQPGTRGIHVVPGGAGDLALVVRPEGWPTGEVLVAPDASVRVENATTAEQLVLVERLAWSDQAATAAEVIVLQAFRDLFASEALRPGERIAVGQVTLVFTDLLGSTRLYREVGDAPAFGHVMDHFAVLRDAVAAEGGGLVKTMGDAIMAAFRRPLPALRAVLEAQRRLAAGEGSRRPLTLRAGIHAGPCIAVTLNERLDYFGSAVNLAARLEGLSRGGDLVVSGVVADDPEVAAWLAGAGPGVTVERFETPVRGFDGERFTVCRIARRW